MRVSDVCGAKDGETRALEACEVGRKVGRQVPSRAPAGRERGHSLDRLRYTQRWQPANQHHPLRRARREQDEQTTLA